MFAYIPNESMRDIYEPLHRYAYDIRSSRISGEDRVWSEFKLVANCRVVVDLTICVRHNANGVRVLVLSQRRGFWIWWAQMNDDEVLR